MNIIGFQRLIKDIDKASNRLAFSIIIAAILLGSSILVLSGLGERIWGFPVFASFGIALAFILGMWLLISIIRSGRL